MKIILLASAIIVLAFLRIDFTVMFMLGLVNGWYCRGVIEK